MILRLNLVTANPGVATVITTYGLVVVAMMALFALGAWIVVARGRARRDTREFADSPDDEVLETLRGEHLVAKETRPEAVVAQLEPVADADPAPPQPGA